MDIREVRVEVGRTVNDGNYGAERVSMGLTATTDGEPSAVIAERLVTLCRQVILAALRESPSPGVQSAIRHEEQARPRLRPEQEVAVAPA